MIIRFWQLCFRIFEYLQEQLSSSSMFLQPVIDRECSNLDPSTILYPAHDGCLSSPTTSQLSRPAPPRPPLPCLHPPPAARPRMVSPQMLKFTAAAGEQRAGETAAAAAAECQSATGSRVSRGPALRPVTCPHQQFLQPRHAGPGHCGGPRWRDCAGHSSFQTVDKEIG